MRASLPASALVAVVVGVGGTLPLVIAAAAALDATTAQTASWVTAVALAIAATTLALSWRLKMPVITAWSTPGLALIGASTGYTMNEAVGAFIVTALLLVATGLFRPLTRLIARIPASIASAMLAGIVVTFVMRAAQASAADAALLLPLVALFFAMRLWNPSLSVLAVLIAGSALAFALGRVAALPQAQLSTLVLTQPEFSLRTAIGLGLPLYLVTMASQNLSGIAVLKAYGYAPPAGRLIAMTGLGSLLTAPFNASSTNLAAISSAICTGPEAHPDPAQRWKTGPCYALIYLLIAAFGASLVALFAALPAGLIVLIAGLGLLGPLANALTIAMERPGDRMAAAVTFGVTASGLVVAGIGAAFWGLVAGLAVLALERSFAPHSRS